ncbi:NAD(P)/FAD-dependent oxidoreductase [Halegenticoccus soli]|uniref:NAD(P)/FAD-dependent oxidoreductase n=1 Tax=Halegenticoccus soli TaxID=1985678 RepID=UPI000C6E8CF0|nr:FAD-dependent oxidoreductase [Halegenticoccus soli]
MTDRVAVVGAGAVGVTAAHDLAAAGADVTVYDRGEPGSGSSGRAAGVLYDAYAGDVDAAIGARALERFRELSGEGDFEFVECPYVFLAREGDAKRAAAIEESAERMRRRGRDVSPLSPAELGERFPTLTGGAEAAAVAENAGWTDPGNYVSMMADRAAAAGARFETGAAADVLLDPPGVAAGGERERFDAVLVAAGAHTKRVLADAGVAVPLKPYRVQALTGGARYDGPMCYDATAGIYFRPHPTGLLAGDGTEPVEADPDAWDRTADGWFVEAIRSGLRERAGYDLRVERAWAGLCTATPDGNPLLGELGSEGAPPGAERGVFVAAGWQGHGFMRAPAIGEAVAAAMLGEEGALPTAFDPNRFDGSEEFEIAEGMVID